MLAGRPRTTDGHEHPMATYEELGRSAREVRGKGVRFVRSLPARARERWWPVGEDPHKTSYSQSGEDLILTHLLHHLGLPRPSYVDLGAHHPLYLNNTALFYQDGGRGVNVEPDPALITTFSEMRPEDVNLNVAVGTEKGELDFYVMSTPTLNTLSRADALNSESLGHRIEKVISVEVLPIAEIFARLPQASCPDVLSVDVEGLDLEILTSIDFDAFPVPVVCVETLSFAHFGYGEKNSAIFDLMRSRGYAVYADTYLNTIFVRRQAWDTMLQREGQGLPVPLA